MDYAITADDGDIIPLCEYAARIGRDIRTVQRRVKAGRIPAWTDPVTGDRVTSIGAIERIRRLAAEKAEREHIQKRKLGGK